jgi:hypothetical protein
MKAQDIIKRIMLKVWDEGEGIYKDVLDPFLLAELLEEITEGKTDLTNNTEVKMEELYNTLMDTWNVATSAQAVGVPRPRNIYASKLLPNCRKFTPQIKKALVKLTKEKYTEEDIKTGIVNYIKEICNRNPDNDFSKHRFSFYEFVKQENGFLKYFNK